MEAISGVRLAMDTVATDDEILEAIDMLSAGLKVSGQVNGRGIGKVYSLVMADAPSAVLTRAVRDLVTGKAEGMDKTFMPSAPELREYLDRVKRDWLAMATMTERMLSLPEQPAPPEPMTEDQLMRRRERIAALARPRSMPGDAA